MPSGPESAGDDPADLVAWLRRGLLGLAAFSVAGTAIELAMLRHWSEGTQLIAWGALAALALGIALALRASSPGTVRAARIIALVVCAAALFGAWEHIEGNYDVAPLDAEYGTRWDTMSEAARWWAAFTKSVGPSPALAPFVLAQAALCVLLACHRHPVDHPLPPGPAPSRFNERTQSDRKGAP